MHHVLLVVEKPTSNSDNNEQRWRGCVANLKDTASKNKEIQLLGENVVLISLQNNLNAVSEIVHEKILGLSYKYLILDEEIEWHVVSKKDPNPL